MPTRWRLLFPFIAGLTLCLSAQTESSAKPDPSKEAFVFQLIENRVRYENDGSGTRETTAVIRIQSQGGVQQFGQLIFGYSSATEKLEVSYVRVRKPSGQVVATPAASAQDFAPDILRQAPMYSDYRQRHVSVVDLQPGDILEYRTVTTISPLAPGEFWYEHDFPRQVVVQQDSLQIDVPKSRDVKLESPDHKYDVQENGDRRVYTWTIRDFLPKRLTNPDADDEDDDSDTTDVQLSTFSDWKQVAHWYAKLQRERVVVDDNVRKKADELARGANSPEEKTRRLYDYVARNIRYVSLSFGVGRLQPHAASEVLQNGYGDCKDKHTLLAGLLRAEGIQSYPVLITSGRKLDADMPSPAQFNHVITAVRLGDGLTWLDTTTEVAPYGLLLYQLRNKQAVLATDDASAGLVRTPAESPIENLVTINVDGKFTEPGAMDADLELTAQGDSDFPLRAVLREVPQANWQKTVEYLTSNWGLPGDVSDIHISPLEETGKPLQIKYRLHVDNYFQVPTSGTNFRLLPPPIPPVATRPNRKKPAEPIDVGPAEQRVYRARIQIPANYVVHVPTAVKMTRDYGEYSSSYRLNGGVLQAERRMVLKVNELPPSRWADYNSFRTLTAGQADQGLWCSISPPSKTAIAAAVKTGGTPQEMRSAGFAALQRRDFTTAVELLKRALERDANLKDTWDDLGRAYAGLNQHDDAVRAFRRQLEIDPYHERANSDLAEELQQQGKLDEAVAAFKRQLEIAPSDKLAHKRLGLLLVQLKRDPEAQSELEAAAAIPPDDPEVKIALSQIYGRSGDRQKADALMKSVIGVSSAVAGSDAYAAALRDVSDPNVTLHDARQTLSDLGDQFDSGEYDRLGPSAFSAMNLVALAWARIGWARFLQGETLEAMQYLNASWMLGQSGSVGNRLAQVLEKEGQREKSRHAFALAVAAGGSEAQASRQELLKLSSDAAAAEKEIAQASQELVQMRTIKLPALTTGTASARFALVFDSSNKPDRVEYLEGDAALNGVSSKLQEKEYPVKFPDVSSVKIVRKAELTCTNSACALVLAPLDGLSPAPSAASPR